MAVENLNDIPPELKPLAPFLQRSQELKVKDPTMSYWCLYYAVQQGVHLKPRDKESRNYLLKLMTPLETIRADRVSNVLTDEKQASNYIEDFALRVFDSADNEDRRGDATRGTAKKFLAAANFLELLKVFEESPNNPSTSQDNGAPSAFSQHKDKIRYAKWKAGDIAKAFREGRRPTPGPAHGPDIIRRELEAAAIEPPFGPGPGPTGADGQPRQFSRDSSSASSPIPGGSRNASVSPGRRNIMLPLTSVGNGEPGSRPMISPPASATSSAFGFPPPLSQPLIREPATTPPATTPSKPSAPPFNRSHSQSHSVDHTRPGPPAPPRDLLSLATPVKAVVGPNGIHLGPGKPGVSPGGWSTAATPGGFEESVRKMGAGFIDQSSPSRVPEGAKRPQDDSAYPPRPYPPTPALALKSIQQGEDDSKRLPNVGRQESFASNVATSGGFLSRTTSYKSQDTAPAKPSEEPEARPGPKRVRWTPSVVGGTSTVASNSPPHSPLSPLGKLPALPESDSSSNEGVRFSRPTTDEKDANGRRAPKNPYAEYPTPAARSAQLPPVPPVKPSPPHSPAMASTQPGSQPGSATSSLITSANGIRRSPMPPPKNLPTDQAGTPKGSVIVGPSQPPQTGFTLSVVPSAPPSSFSQFPVTSAPVSPATSNMPKSTNPNAPLVPTRLRRASESATGSPQNGIQPLVKPFVPRFPAHPGTNSTDSSPAGSTLINTISMLGRPKSLTPTPTSSPPPPPQKPSPPLPRKAISPPPPASISAIRDLPNSVNGRSSPTMNGRGSPFREPGRMPTPPAAYQPAKELPKSLPFRQISAAKKHSKFAASALEFDDLETARQELMAALAILNGERLE
ncbi:hypothetical protein FRC04_006492 [Tulasnella sp. 424]|nr:hypothetical protein FRC04_006492 [Tulasnella sp. 424]KAG8981048.1 hypothetical protein FRC05_003948 [Tulasnella sp. 425]